MKYYFPLQRALFTVNASGKKITKNPLRLDPTRTIGLRMRYEREMHNRFEAIRKAIRQWVEVADELGLAERKPFVALNARRYEFLTDDKKVEAFQNWFQAQVDANILSVTPGTKDPWTAKYVSSAHRQGLMRAYIDTKKEAMAKRVDFWNGTQEQFLKQAFAQPEMTSKVRLLYTRSYDDLKDVSSTMAKDMNRILAQGLADGKGPREVARELAKGVTTLERKRAIVIARTEMIHAHSEGQLDGFEELGVEEVGIMAEVLTAGDDRVCSLCQSKAGLVLTVKEARGVIPFHPQCRCAFMPSLREGKPVVKKKKPAPEPAPKKPPVLKPAPEPAVIVPPPEPTRVIKAPDVPSVPLPAPEPVLRTPPAGVSFTGERTAFTEKAWSVVDQMQATDNPKEQVKYARQLGDMIKAEAETRFKPKIGDLKGLQDQVVQTYNTFFERKVAGAGAEELQTLRSAFDSLKEQKTTLLAKSKAEAEQYHKAVYQVLSEVRDFKTASINYAAGSGKQAKELLGQMTSNLPHDWTRPLAEGTPWKVGTNGRGYMDSKSQTIMISAKGGRFDHVAAHELAHTAEKHFPKLGEAQYEYLKTRIKPGEKPVGIHSPDASEVGYKDEFPDHYTGKVYGNKKHFEVLTTGVEFLTENAAQFAARDPDHFSFTIGLMAGL